MKAAFGLIALVCLVSVIADGQQQGVDTQQAVPVNNNSSALDLPDCADTLVPSRQIDLAASAPIIITGITLAAGPGAGRCNATNGNLNIALDNSTNPQTNFIVMGIQCVHKGLVSCRNNEEDTKDCLILIAAPTMKDAAPCSIAQGERYQVYLQEKPFGCPGYYLTQYEHIYHSVRRPLGGTGCTFYPTFPDPQELKQKLPTTCDTPTPCGQDMCDPMISKSPCANDTSCACTLKTCPGKWMYHNAILPEGDPYATCVQDTCYEVYNYVTSGIPTNCYGRRYINNRIRQLAARDPGLLGNMTDGNSTSSNSTAGDGSGGGAAAGSLDPSGGNLNITSLRDTTGAGDAADVFTTNSGLNDTTAATGPQPAAALAADGMSGDQGASAADASGSVQQDDLPSDSQTGPTGSSSSPGDDPLGALNQMVQPLQQQPQN